MKKGLKIVKDYVCQNKVEMVRLGLMAAVVVAPMINNNLCEAAASAGASMPWKSGTESLMSELSGPLPKIAGIVSVAATGMMMAFGEMQGMAKKGIQTVFGLGMAISSASLVGVLAGTDTATITNGLGF